jgi:recombination protein RecR
LSETEALAEALRAAKAKVRNCKTCLNLTESEFCRICADPGRQTATVCVVEQPPDVDAIERSRSYSGVYHVLHGRLSPLHGIGPEGIRVKELLARVKAGGISEIILATDPDTEGEATALYLASVLKDLGVRVTRIALGVPMGAHLDYMDERTLSAALKSRQDFSTEPESETEAGKK